MRAVAPFLFAALTAAGACSLRGTSQLTEGRGGSGGLGGGGLGGGGVGGVGGTGGGTGGSLGGGGGCAVDCDGDGTCDDLMTSEDHCGVCDVSCSPGPCEQGACVIAMDMAPGGRMMGMATDENELFYAGSDGGVTNVFRMPYEGGTPQSLVAVGSTIVSDVYVSPGNIYIVLEGQPPIVAKGDKAQILNPMQLQTFAAQDLSRIDGADVTVCWTIPNGVLCTFNDNAQTPIDLGQTTGDVAVSGGAVYVTTASGEVHTANITGADTPSLVATFSGATGISGIDIDQGVLYVAAKNGIWTTTTQGAEPQQITTRDHVTPFDLVVQQGQIYLTDAGSAGQVSRLLRAPIAGGEEEVLFEGPDALIAYVEVRNEWVYFSDFDGARLYRRHIDAPAP